jgi:catechol 2,3-dioxygenase-like lactoylglutathione lyase family enzyme
LEAFKVKIEHIGVCVSAPISMGKWYQDHLGLKIIRSAGDDLDGVSFLIDDAGTTVLELGRLPEGPPLDGRSLLPLQLHLAIECENPVSEAERLVEAGAKLLGESPRNAYPGERILMRDPWGYTIQLVNRRNKLLNNSSNVIS